MARVVATAVLLTAVASSSADAQESAGAQEPVTESSPAPARAADRPFQLDVHAGLAWWGVGFTAGVRFGIPIVKDGLIGSLDDALYLNAGADMYFVGSYCVRDGCRDYGVGLGFPVALHWELYFGERWSVFVELGVNVYLPPTTIQGRPSAWGPGPWFLGAVGGTLRLGESVGLILRVGNPSATFGLQFEF